MDANSLSLPSGFSLVAPFVSPVQPGGSTTFTVRLDAGAAGTYSGQLSFANSDGDENPFNFAISGDVADVSEPEIEVVDASQTGIADGTGSVDFGTTPEGTALAQTFTINNVGTADLTLDPASLSMPSGFSMVSAFAATVAPGGSTTLTIQLDETTAGSYGGTLSFGTNDADENPFDFAISGEVTIPSPEIAVVDASSTAIADGSGSVDFGSTSVGTAVEQTFTVNNTGTAELTLDTASLTVPTGFSVTNSFAATVAPGGSTSFTVRLDGSAVGSYVGTVSFSTNDADENPYDFAVSGEVTTGPEPEIQVLDASQAEIVDGAGSVDFGTTPEGTALSQTLTIKNLGTADLALDPASLSVPSGFSVVTAFAATVAPGGSTTLTVQLDGTTAGTYGGTLSFNDNDSDENPFDFTISGEVLTAAPEIKVTTSSWDDIPNVAGNVDFGTTPIGAPVTFQFWIQNLGDADLTLDRDSLVLPSGFSVYSRFGTTVAAGAKTLFIVELGATASGTFSGQVSFATNDADENPFDFTLSGTVEAATGPVTLDDLGLFKDTGTSDTDQVTSNPMLTGVVNGDFGGGYVHVEFDHDQDHGSVTGFAKVLSTASNFLYDPREYDPSLVGFAGPVSIYHRLVEYDALGAVVATGNWSEFAFTLESSPSGGPAVYNLRLLDDTGQSPTDGVTSDPTLTVDVPAQLGDSGVAVEFEVDGVVQGNVGTGSEGGSVTYYPLGLGYGVPSTIRARGKSWDLQHGMYVYGNWTDPIAITVRQDPPPEIVELKLKTDTGEDNTDNITSDATLTGQLDPSADTPTSMRIEFDHDGDGVAEAETWTGSTGNFVYEPTGLADGTATTIRARSSRWDSLVEEYVYGSWYSLTFTYGAVPPTVVSELKLSSPLAGQPTVTEDPTLRGELTSDGSTASVAVEFDHDGDGVVDGTTISGQDGKFSYYVTGLTPGPSTITVRARTSEWEKNLDGYAYSDWTSLAFTLQAPANTPVVLDALVLSNDTGTDDADNITTDPTLSGQLSNDGSVAYLKVEFREGGSSIGYTLTDAEGRFTFSPSDLASGTLTVEARAREWDYAAGDFLYSDWVPLAFTLEAIVVAAPVVEQLALLCDTGPSQTDGYTANPTLVGSLTDDGDMAGLTVEFDHDGADGVEEVHGAAFTDSDGAFHYRPTALSFGQQTVKARAKRWDDVGQSWLVGNWTQVTFQYEDQPNTAAVLVGLGLANDTGTDTTDNVTTDPTLAGQFLYSGWTSFAFTYEEPVNVAAEVSELALVTDLDETGTDPRASDPALTGLVTNDGPAGGLLVQFDHDGDGVIEATAITDSDGRFIYQPAGLELGAVTMRARAKEYDDQSAPLYGAWYPFQFTLEAPAATSVNVSQLVLANDTGVSSTDGSTDDATVTGQVAGPGMLEGVTIEFDHNGDGAVDGTTTTDASGWFTHTPTGLEEGRATIRARTMDDDVDSPVVGNWKSVSFVYSSDPDGAEAQDLAARPTPSSTPTGRRPRTTTIRPSQPPTLLIAPTLMRLLPGTTARPLRPTPSTVRRCKQRRRITRAPAELPKPAISRSSLPWPTSS